MMDFIDWIHLIFVVLFYRRILKFFGQDFNHVLVFQSVASALKKWITWNTSTLMSRSIPGKLSSNASTVSWVSL
jgi:hypothetical protein